MNEEKNNIITTNEAKQWTSYSYLPEIVKKEKASIKRGPFGSTLKKSFFVEKGFKIYEQKNVIRNDFKIGEYYISEDKFKELSDFEIKADDILISCSGTIGKVVIVPENIERGIMNQALLKLSLNNSKILNEYFVYFFKNYVALGELENKGAAIQNIASVSELKKIPIPLPSLNKQKTIVHQLNTLYTKIDKAIELAQENLEHINHLLAAALNEIYVEFKDVYSFYTVNELCNKVTDGTHATPKYISSGVPFLSVKDITGVTINFSNTRFISKEEHEQLTKRCKPELDDVLYTKVGTTGVAKVVDTGREFSIFVSLALLKPKKELIKSKYLEFLLNSPNAYEQAQSRTRGVANRNLVLKDIKEIEIPVPDLATQEKVVSYLNSLRVKQQQLQQQFERKLHQLQSLKASLLDAAFRGELTQQTAKAKVIQLPPETFSVVAEDEAVYQTSAPLNIPQEKRAFAKQVLAGKIISLFKDDTNFTPIKFQKLQYLAEHIVRADLNWNYYYQSAGPYDNVFMHSIDAKLKRSQWFNLNGKKYTPLNKANEIDKYYDGFFTSVNNKLEKLFTHFHNASEAQSEIVATLYAVWNNLLIKKEQILDDIIINKFYQWSDRKGQYTQERLLAALKWMRENNIVPVGFGKEIKKAKK